MPVTDSTGRRQCIPILYTKGTHYEVGYDMDLLRHDPQLLEDQYLAEQMLSSLLRHAEGRKAYEDTLNCVKANFPQYIRELEGIADGARVPFHKLFLLHMDNIVAYACRKECEAKPQGCSTICVNQKGQEILGHTEDALSETLNHYYYVSAHIVSDKPEGKWKVTEEKFTSLCYAGHLPGYTMGYNHHGLLLHRGKLLNLYFFSARHFLTRALLSAENFVKAKRS
nr:unnamed protein product [Callosobruchus chinensis]